MTKALVALILRKREGSVEFKVTSHLSVKQLKRSLW